MGHVSGHSDGVDSAADDDDSMDCFGMTSSCNCSEGLALVVIAAMRIVESIIIIKS